jgi:hypothetical protein
MVSTYPYTVIYEYEIHVTNRGLYHMYKLYPQTRYNQSTELSEFNLSYPESLNLRFKEYQVDEEVKSQVSLGRRIMKTWIFKNLPARRWEYLTKEFHEISPCILFAPTHFIYDGYNGNSETWQDYGKWIGTLNQGRDQLPASRIQYLNDLVKDLSCDMEKARKIFNDMQTRTRYVNISLGIGGIQPFDAATVDRTGYGDCKALSNYYVSMLKAVGITSFYTLIYTGKGEYDFYPDFPTSQFNHVIVCIPLQNDTLWVECTSQQIPFGYLGNNDSRYALLITENGGVLAKTPRFKKEDNFYNSKAIVNLEVSGNGQANIHWSMGGMQYGSVYGFSELGGEDQRKWLYNKVPVANFNMGTHRIERTQCMNPVFNIDLQIQLRSYASLNGTRLFLPLNMLSAIKQSPPRVRNRQTSFELKYEMVYNDTIVFNIPSGYIAESQLPQWTFETDFGAYRAKVEMDDRVIYYIRQMETYSGVFPPDRYQDYFDFYQRIIRADEQRLVLIRL